MEKEEYRKAFEAGWNSREPQIDGGWITKITFDKWYNTVVLPQANVIKSVCVCGRELDAMDLQVAQCYECGNTVPQNAL